MGLWYTGFHKSSLRFCTSLVCSIIVQIRFLTSYISNYRVNYKFCPLCLHQISDAVLFSKSLQVFFLIFQNLARYVL
ncbi:hypothetical protein Hanom_Chr10g00902231 [Helianthus anomalus]